MTGFVFILAIVYLPGLSFHIQFDNIERDGEPKSFLFLFGLAILGGLRGSPLYADFA